MGKVVYAWELGLNFGHVGSFASVHQQLITQGVQVRCVLREPSAGVAFGFTEIQPAPSAPKTALAKAALALAAATPEAPLSFSQILLQNNWDDAQVLLRLVEQWREHLFDSKVLVADFAPTALLAARTLNLPALVFGNGFSMPSLTAPIPALRPWQTVPVEILQALDAQVLQTANQVLEKFKAPLLASVADLFRVAENRICSVPELDRYPSAERRYWGVIEPADSGLEAMFPAPSSPTSPPITPHLSPQPLLPRRIFAYLRPEHLHLDVLLNGLAVSGAALFAFIPSPAVAQIKTPPHVKLVNQPVNLHSVARQADLVVCSGYNTPAAMLLAGIPVLSIPTQIEQFLLSRRIEEHGLGLTLRPDEAATDAQVAQLAARLLHEPAFRQRARAFAARYQSVSVSSQIAERILELMQSGSSF